MAVISVANLVENTTFINSVKVIRVQCGAHYKCKQPLNIFHLFLYSNLFQIIIILWTKKSINSSSFKCSKRLVSKYRDY